MGVDFQITAVRDVYLLVRRGEELLLLLRSRTGYKDGQWGPPSGKVEPGETYVDAAVRELAEETGLTVTTGDLRFVHAIERRNVGEPPWVGMFFSIILPAGAEATNREPEKHGDLRWFPVSALPPDTVGYVVHVLASQDRFTEWTE